MQQCARGEFAHVLYDDHDIGSKIRAKNIHNRNIVAPLRSKGVEFEHAGPIVNNAGRRDTHASEQRQRDVILLQKFCGKFSDSIQCACSLLQKRLTHTEFVNHVRLEIHKDQTQLLWPQLNTQQKQLICKRKQLWTLAANIS